MANRAILFAGSHGLREEEVEEEDPPTDAEGREAETGNVSDRTRLVTRRREARTR